MEQRPAAVTVDEVMRKHGLQFKTESLAQLNQLQTNKAARQGPARLWLESQTRKWAALVATEQLNQSLDQRRREAFYNAQGPRPRIRSNDILSQLQGRIQNNLYTVLSIAQNKANYV